MTAEELSIAIEALTVQRNPRQMARLREAMPEGYYLRAAQQLAQCDSILIATGFPIADTFETDGPLGAIVLYRALTRLGTECTIACADPLARAIAGDFRVLTLAGFDHESAQQEAQQRLAELEPDVILSIERPGLATDGRYYNMRGVDISDRCAIFDYYVTAATCPTIAIGDGGNEIGMGRVARAVAELDIRGAQTSCDELLVADVSNWGAYGLIAMLEALTDMRLLEDIDHRGLLAYLSDLGSLDGVTGENTLTEDGFEAEAGEELLSALSAMLKQTQDIDGTLREGGHG